MCELEMSQCIGDDEAVRELALAKQSQSIVTRHRLAGDVGTRPLESAHRGPGYASLNPMAAEMPSQRVGGSGTRHERREMWLGAVMQPEAKTGISRTQVRTRRTEAQMAPVLHLGSGGWTRTTGLRVIRMMVLRRLQELEPPVA